MIELKDFRLKNVKYFRSREGQGFNADLWCQGKKIAFAADSGDGGEMLIEWLGGQHLRRMPDFMKAFLMSAEAKKIGDEREREFRARMPELYVNEPMPSRWCEADFIEYLLEQHEIDRLAKRYGFIYAPADDPKSLMYFNVPRGFVWTKQKLEHFRAEAVSEYKKITVLRDPTK